MSDGEKKRRLAGPLLSLCVGVVLGSVFGWPKNPPGDPPLPEPPEQARADWKSTLAPAAAAGNLRRTLAAWQSLAAEQMEDFLRHVDTLPEHEPFWNGSWKRYQTDAFLHAALLDAWHSAAPEKAVAYAQDVVAGTANHGAALTFGTALWFGSRFPDKVPADAPGFWLTGIVEASPLLALQRGGGLPTEPGPPLPRPFFRAGPFSEPVEALALIDALPEDRRAALAADLYDWWAESDPEAAWQAFLDRPSPPRPVAMQAVARRSPTKATKFAVRLSDDEVGGCVLAAIAGMESAGLGREAKAFADELFPSQITRARAFWETRDYERVPQALVPHFVRSSVEDPLSPALLKAIVLPSLGGDASLTPLTHLAQSGETLDDNDATVAVLGLARNGLAALWDAIANLPDSALKTTLAGEAARQSAAAQPAEALPVLGALPSESLRRTALPVFVANAPENLRGAISTELWPKITDPELRNRVAYAISRWQPDAASQAAWLQANAPDVLGWPDLQRLLGERWVQGDPDGFASWVEALGDPDVRRGFSGFLIGVIAAKETERAEQLASDLLLSGGALPDDALGALGKAKVKSDPVAALAWTQRIASKTARQEALTQLIPDLKKLSESERARLLSTAPISETTTTFLRSALSEQ